MKYLIFIIILGFILRIAFINFPALSADEARIGFRGYTLSQTGKDELGRNFPIIFNSSVDYQLPVASYLVALGEKILGKNDWGLRLPFILIGLLLIPLIFLIAKIFALEKRICYLSAFVVAASPGLIFLSKIPNELIILTTFIFLLFYLLIKEKLNNYLIFAVLLIILLTSKLSWLLLFPFVGMSLLIRFKLYQGRYQVKYLVLTVTLVVVSLLVFLLVPQSIRSLSENNFSLFQDVGIKNGIEKLRGQGLNVGWPNFFERILFNKSHFIFVGILGWLGSLSLSSFFGSFDKNGIISFAFIAPFQKILIVPFIVSFYQIFKKKDIKNILLFLILMAITFPAVFIYPNQIIYIPLVLPIFALIIGIGFKQMNLFLITTIIGVALLEVLISLSNIQMEVKNSQELRPKWIKQVVGFLSPNINSNKRIILSEDLSEDILVYVAWYDPNYLRVDQSGVDWPYKYIVKEQGNINVVFSEDHFRRCGSDEDSLAILSKRDVVKVSSLKPNIEQTFKDDLGKNIAFKVDRTICIN